MGKAEKGSAKYIANRIKAKGLQKLRWYCQMCQKQCRDENGFKCHTMSESHQRQLLLFADNASKYIDDFSQEFKDGYMELLKRQYGTKRVNANKVYQDYIGNREHIHMNATQWETLTEFVKYLGRDGACIVDETEKGWFVTYIDRDPAALAAQEKRDKRDKMDKDDQERMLEFIQKQVERDKKKGGEEVKQYSEFKRENSQERVTLSLNVKKKPDELRRELPLVPPSTSREEPPLKKKRKEEKTRHAALDDIMQAEERAREKANRKDYWLTEGIIVKIVTRSLGAHYYGRKARVDRVVDKFAAHVVLLDDNVKLKLDQNHLESVIPSAGRAVRVVNGAYRGLRARLDHIHTDRYCCDIQITEGPLTGRLVKGVQYEDLSKLAV